MSNTRKTFSEWPIPKAEKWDICLEFWCNLIRQNLNEVILTSEGRAVHILEDNDRMNFSSTPENKASNKFQVVYLSRNSQFHNHGMQND